jgi:2Fe-2S ferredoxin
MRKYKVTFLPSGKTVEVDPACLPYGSHGLPGSLLDIALHYGIDIDHACGGVCACSTCHVVIRAGVESCNESSEKENDQLDVVPGLQVTSRLACQCVPDGARDIVVEIPAWNRNLAREQ